MIAKCLPPVINNSCKVIILGSMPSVMSRIKTFYYANPSNRFWKILSAIAKVDFTAMTTEQKKAALLENRIALFDVFQSCEIEGSLDSDIKDYKLNDIESIIEGTEIQTIYITSKFAYNAFIKRYGKEIHGIKVISLPSPSGANRSKFKTDEDLLSEWKRLLVL